MPQRGRQHAVSSVWFDQVKRTTFESYPTREAAAAAERVAVINERPLHNVVYRKQTIIERATPWLAQVPWRLRAEAEEENLIRDYFRWTVPTGAKEEVVVDGCVIGRVIPMRDDDDPSGGFVALGLGGGSGIEYGRTYRETEEKFLNNGYSIQDAKRWREAGLRLGLKCESLT